MEGGAGGGGDLNEVRPLKPGRVFKGLAVKTFRTVRERREVNGCRGDLGGPCSRRVFPYGCPPQSGDPYLDDGRIGPTEAAITQSMS